MGFTVLPMTDFAFAEKLDERLICPICGGVFREPWQTSCGHRYCKQCLDLLLRSERPRCPVDGETIVVDEVFPDRCCNREVLALPCFCRFKERGCKWKGEFRHVQVHEESCPFGDVQCQACGRVVQRCHLAEHQTNECVNRAIVCAFCGGNIPKSNMQEHMDVCPKVLIPCILNCGREDIPRDMMEEHVTYQCPNTEVLCHFSDQGCDFKGSKEALEQHLKDNIKVHLDLMCHSSKEHDKKRMEMEKKIADLENKKLALEQQLLNQNEELAAAKQNIRTQQTKITIIDNSVHEQKKHMEKLRCDLQAAVTSEDTGAVASQLEEIMTTIRLHEEQMNNLQSELARLKVSNPRSGGHEDRLSPRSATSCERRLDRNEHQLALHEIQLADQDLKLQMMEATSYDGVFFWKIDNYSRRFQEAVNDKTPSIYSPPFYVGRFGYKVCVRMYPNGDGMGKGRYMSLFFVLMRGEYDALLPWPFAQKVHFRLIDQDRVRDMVDAFRPDPNSSSFKRPTGTMNIASGCPTFISHSTLQEGGYICNDTMFIKVTVDMTCLQGESGR